MVFECPAEQGVLQSLQSEALVDMRSVRNKYAALVDDVACILQHFMRQVDILSQWCCTLCLGLFFMLGFDMLDALA